MTLAGHMSALLSTKLWLLFSLNSILTAQSIYQWSFQQRLFVPEGGATYATTPSALIGRGYMTLISGYGVNDTGDARESIYIHTTDDGYAQRGYFIWSQQAKLVAEDSEVGDEFGKWLVNHEETIIISAPNGNSQKGALYVFNGTKRHWSQVQKLLAVDCAPGDLFGQYLSLSGDRIMVGAQLKTESDLSDSLQDNCGAAYIFERNPGSLFWSRQSKLIARDLSSGAWLGGKVGLYGEVAIATSRSDADSRSGASHPGKQSGSAYIFKGSGTQWSQQQKLIGDDISDFHSSSFLELQDLTFGSRIFGRDVAITPDGTIAVTITNNSTEKPIRDGVYIFKGSDVTNRWSLNQRLFAGKDNVTAVVDGIVVDSFNGTDLYVDQETSTLIGIAIGQNSTDQYVFKTAGNGFSLQQKLEAGYESHVDNLQFSRPNVAGGWMITTGARNELQLRSKYRNDSCLLFWLSDHFLDGWDTAVLTMRAPDITNDTFHPHCDQVDPFLVRYCPKQPEDEGIYIAKVFAATSARFFWEISWQVQVEKTGEWYKGDFATKMMFNYNLTTGDFSLVAIENEINMTSPCYRCTTIASRSWDDLQETGDDAFWPLWVTGAPYYISDSEGKLIYASGKMCYGVAFYECYQRLPDGQYLLRLGGGLFGRETHLPENGAHWEGCGRSGTHREQFLFGIIRGRCHPLQVFNYTTRCDRPEPISAADTKSFWKNEYTQSPTGGGTVMPSQSVFGEPWVAGEMYAHREKGGLIAAAVGGDAVDASIALPVSEEEIVVAAAAASDDDDNNEEDDDDEAALTTEAAALTSSLFGGKSKRKSGSSFSLS